MSLTSTCPRCGGDLTEGAARCEQCGHLLAAGAGSPAPTAAPAAPKLIAGVGCWMVTVMLLLISIVVVFGLLLAGLLGAAGARPA
jgi:uncharacterized membrane protein YvbJ